MDIDCVITLTVINEEKSIVSKDTFLNESENTDIFVCFEFEVENTKTFGTANTFVKKK